MHLSSRRARVLPGARARWAISPVILDLAVGPFRMVAGAYELRRTARGTPLTLSSEYELCGAPVEAGKIKAVGVSNYSAEQMRTAHAALDALLP